MRYKKGQYVYAYYYSKPVIGIIISIREKSVGRLSYYRVNYCDIKGNIIPHMYEELYKTTFGSSVDTNIIFEDEVVCCADTFGELQQKWMIEKI